ncbi:MAG TPA: DUF3667 domain-containing protein [Bacteroidales bacterium]
MTITCKNCHQDYIGNFCNHCGQPAETHEMSIHFVWHDIQHGLLHMDKGILFTTKELFTRPGHTIREFINGKRVKHFKPISFVLVLAGVYGFLYHYFDISLLADKVTVYGSTKEVSDYKRILENVNGWVVSHYAVVVLVQLPIYALGTFIAFGKRSYNYVEHLVLNAFITGQKLILNIAVFPLVYLYNKTHALKQIDGFVNLIVFGLATWTLLQFFNDQPWKKTFARALLSYFIFFVVYYSIISLIGLYIVNSYHL